MEIDVGWRIFGLGIFALLIWLAGKPRYKKTTTEESMRELTDGIRRME